MADQALIEAFNDCIDRLAAGQSIDDCLRRYPHYALVLRPMLEAGSLIDRTQAASFEVAAAQMRVRARVQARLQAPPRRRSYFGLMVAAASLVIALLAVFGASESSLPGDPLYGVKRFTENVRTDVVGEQFGSRRLDEVQVLLALKRAAHVDFSGEVEHIDGSNWVVSGLNLQVNPNTSGAGSVSVGDQIQVSAATTAQGDLIASAITLLKKNQPPAPTLTPTSTLTSTSTATFTPTNTPTVTPTVTLSATPTPTHTPNPTIVVSPIVTTTKPVLVPPSATVFVPTQPPSTVAPQRTTSVPDDHQGPGGDDGHGGGSGSGNSGSGGGDQGGENGHGGSGNSGSGSSGGGTSGGPG